jgi:hypothetical protein
MRNQVRARPLVPGVVWVPYPTASDRQEVRTMEGDREVSRAVGIIMVGCRAGL